MKISTLKILTIKENYQLELKLLNKAEKQIKKQQLDDEVVPDYFN